MNQDRYVFAQVIEFLNRSKFNRIVAKYNGDRYVKSYSTWNQLLTLIFGQLSVRQVCETALWNLTQCSQDTSLCRNHYILPRGYYATRHETRTNHLRGFAHLECFADK